MTITLEISCEAETELARQAAVNGLKVSDYAADLLEAAGASTLRLRSKNIAANLAELFEPLRGLNLEFERDRDIDRDIDYRRTDCGDCTRT